MSDKQAYQAAVDAHSAALKIIGLPRCINCEHYQTGGRDSMCVLYGNAIPDEYLYTPNECAGHSLEIPF